MAWSEDLLKQARKHQGQSEYTPSPAYAQRERVAKHLQEIRFPPPLRRMNGFGLGLYGRLSDDALPAGYVKLYFITALWLPIIPLCAYVVTSDGNAFRFYRRFSLWGVVRSFGWRCVLLYLTALIEGAFWLVVFGGLIVAVVGGVRWLFGRH